MMARKWTAEQRAQQADKIRIWKPWQHSTGARTLAGKAIASHNAFKGGFRQQLKALNQLLCDAKHQLEKIK